MTTITATIVDGERGERILALMDGLTILWRCVTTELDAGRIVDGAASVLQRYPGAEVQATGTDSCDHWRTACVHVLPLHLQYKATGYQVRDYVLRLIENGRAVAKLGLDGGVSEAWANPAGGAPQSFAVTECNRLNKVICDLQAANRRLQDQLSGHTAGPVLTMCDKVAELREEVDELKRALELARAAVAAPPADPPADAPASASPPDPADVYNSRLANAMTLLDHARAHLVAARADAPAGTFDSNRLPAGMRVSEVDAVFDRGRGRKAPRLIGFEDRHGEDRVVGRWIEPSGDPDDDPYWRLRLTVLLPTGKEASATG